jgi:hypothetical protein
MEYVKVTFPTKRPVYIDGEPNGDTNEVLRVDAGRHRFGLGSPANYQPVSRTVMVKETTVLEPLVIAFTKQADG